MPQKRSPSTDDRGQPELRRAIGPSHATAMVVGTIIGASIFVQQSNIAQHVHSVWGVLLVWGAAGVLTLFGALATAELASTFTQTGGVYVYLRQAFSPVAGFLWGWAMFWTMHSGIIAAIAFIFGRYVASFFPGANDQSVKAIAIAGILLLSAVNTFGVKHGARVQTLFTAGKLLAVGAMIVVGFALGERVEEHFVVGADFAANVGWKGFLLAVGAGLFAFGGWHMVAYNSEETINPRRTIPLALLIGVAVVTFCYIALNAVYMYILPLEAIAATDRIAADAAEALIGPAGGAAMAGLVAFSAYGALNGIILAGPRVYYAMARDGLAFKFMGAIHPKFRTPYWALLLQAAWSSVLVWTLAYRQLFTRVVYTEWIFFAMMAVGLFVFRRRKLWRDYSMWGYPVTPIVFIVAALAIVANQILSEPRECAEGLGLVIVGLPVYYVWIFWKGRNQPKGARG